MPRRNTTSQAFHPPVPQMGDLPNGRDELVKALSTPVADLHLSARPATALQDAQHPVRLRTGPEIPAGPLPPAELRGEVAPGGQGEAGDSGSDAWA